MVFVLKDFYSSEVVRSIQHLPVPLNIAYSLWGKKSVVPSVVLKYISSTNTNTSSMAFNFKRKLSPQFFYL